MNLILEKGHSRVPVYYEQPTNIIGLVLVIILPSLQFLLVIFYSFHLFDASRGVIKLDSSLAYLMGSSFCCS